MKLLPVLLLLAYCRISEGYFELVIMHLGSFYGRFEEVETNGRLCSAQSICHGGIARVMYMIEYHRELDKYYKNQKTVFFFAGDIFRGSALYQAGRSEICTEFLNLLQPDAVALGQNEFSDGEEELVGYLKGVNAPVVAANLKLTSDPTLAQLNKVKPSVVITAGGFKIGVIGFVSREALIMYKEGNISIYDPVQAVNAQVEELKKQGVNLFIALGSSSYDTDKLIASKVPDLDLVIGGTDVLQYNGEAPSGHPQDPYPLWVRRHDGRQVAVATTGPHGVYLGHLKLSLDHRKTSGQPLYLGPSCSKQAAAERLLQKWRAKLEVARRTVVGQTSTYMEGGEKSCGQRECLLGSVIADAVVDYARSRNPAPCSQWTRTSVAMLHSGAVTDSIDAPAQDGNVTLGNLMDAMGYNHIWVQCSLPGTDLLKVLEHAVSGVKPGIFLQFAGVRVKYDLRQPVNGRVVSIRRRCSHCVVPSYDYLNQSHVYALLVPEYIVLGGNGFKDLKRCRQTMQLLKQPEVEILEWFFKRFSPIYPEIEGRIRVIGSLRDGATPLSHLASCRCFVSVATVLILIVM